jgi:hypothetical protein
MRETLRVWTETLETFLLEVILEERQGTPAALVRTILHGLSKIFRVAIQIRRFLRDRFHF